MSLADAPWRVAQLDAEKKKEPTARMQSLVVQLRAQASHDDHHHNNSAGRADSHTDGERPPPPHRCRAQVRGKEKELGKMRGAMSELRDEMETVAKENAERMSHAAQVRQQPTPRAPPRQQH